jgi:hydrogenase maturation protease
VTACRARVVGLGQRASGDDAVALAVLERLRALPLVEGVEVVAASDPGELVGLLGGAETVIVVDAVVGAPPGDVLELLPEDVASRPPLPVSTHGIDLAQSIELARILNDGALPAIRIVGIGIAPPARAGEGLSRPAAAAVARATERVRALLGA